MAVFQQLYLAGMSRSFTTIVAIVILALTVAAQDRPHVSLALPSGIASETVQIDYFLTGPFGGYGGFVSPEKERAMYDIDPFVEGRAAKNIKIIAYVPGCEIATMDFTFSGASVERRLDCRPLGSVLFRGQVLPASAKGQNGEIELCYLAMWAHRFFGILDGPVTTFRLGTVRPGPDGAFEIMLPDFDKQSSLGDGAIEFILRDIKTGNIIALLRPAGAAPNSPNWLSVQASYPTVQLVAENQQGTMP
jgi:hypothetical protein